MTAILSKRYEESVIIAFETINHAGLGIEIRYSITEIIDPTLSAYSDRGSTYLSFSNSEGNYRPYNYSGKGCTRGDNTYICFHAFPYRPNNDYIRTYEI